MILKSFMKFLRFFSSFQIGGGGGGAGGVTLENEKLYIFQLFFNQIYFNKKLRHLKPGTGSLNKSKRSSLENVCRALLAGLQ